MIKMHGYIPAWGVPDVSPFVTKIDCYLRMVGLPYELVKLERGDLTKTPKGKLPVIEDDGETVCDSVFIVEYLKKKYGDTLDGDMSASDRAIAVAFGRMLEESFYVYDPIWVEFLDFVPPEERAGPVKEFRERILHEFYWCGKGRHSTEEVEELSRQEYDAISAFLADKLYFMG